MISCPHCGKPIDVEPPAKVVWWKSDQGGGPVSLGCGTLILIAIIVSFFSGGGGEKGAIRELRKDVKALEQKIDNLGKIEIRPAAAEQPTAEKENP